MVHLKYPRFAKYVLVITCLLLMLWIGGIYKYSYNKNPCLYEDRTQIQSFDFSEIKCTEEDKKTYSYNASKFKIYNNIGYLLILLGVIYLIGEWFIKREKSFAGKCLNTLSQGIIEDDPKDKDKD